MWARLQAAGLRDLVRDKFEPLDAMQAYQVRAWGLSLRLRGTDGAARGPPRAPATRPRARATPGHVQVCTALRMCCAQRLSQRDLGVAKMRLLPKMWGMRPIVNMGSNSAATFKLVSDLAWCFIPADSPNRRVTPPRRPGDVRLAARTWRRGSAARSGPDARDSPH